MRRLTHPNYKLLSLALLAAVGCVGVSCGNSSPDSSKKTANANSTPEISESERVLKSLKTADFDFVFSVKRKDGEAFDSEDKAFLKRKTYKANRRRLTKDDTVLFVGSNYKIAEKDLLEIKKRFDYEDFSKPKDQIESEKKAAEKSNSNSEENINS